ncbi:MAG: transcriptional repressor [Planctomycetia bacterium]|nr:transcriptional repressor [Planctomycetia bacterium]
MDTSPAAIEMRLAAFRQRCGALGLALTPQRLAIYQVLAGDASHPGAEDIYRRIKPGMPSLSLGTVYRTLELFEEHGLISRLHAFSDQSRFDANLDDHHHLVCVRCRRIIDFQDDRLRELPVEPASLDGFQVLGHRIHLVGLCAECQPEHSPAARS